MTILRRIRRVLARSERLRLWYLERDLTALEKRYRQEMATAKDQDARGEINSRYGEEEALLDEEMEGIRTERILRKARALRVPYPSPRPYGFNPEDGDENWWFGRIMGGWHLTSVAESKLRQAIRDEQEGSRKNLVFWIGLWTTLIGVLTGLVGAIIGLLAFLGASGK